ncbi:MAG: nuclear transport factor 2 family protein [Marinicella sp.]
MCEVTTIEPLLKTTCKLIVEDNILLNDSLRSQMHNVVRHLITETRENILSAMLKMHKYLEEECGDLDIKGSNPIAIKFEVNFDIKQLIIKESYMNVEKNLISIFLGLIATFFTVACHANEKSYTAIERSNLNKAIYCMEILESRNDLKPSVRIDILRNECYSDNFVEHSPHISGGREGLFRLFENRYKEYPELSMTIKRSASEGDLVWLHLHVKRTPESLGAAIIHIFRMEYGMIVEHWGVGQPVPDAPKNKNSMF